MENKIERYLIDLMFNYREIDKDIWLLEDEEHGLVNVAVSRVENIVIVRVVVMEVPNTKEQPEFFRKLLELNARDLEHGAYGIEKDEVVLIDTLEYDTMDLEDFRATLDAFSLALTQHYPILSGYRK
ncbi:MAG: YbjN domain-containing protein [Treponema sp.]|jgi:hypothetical protein|nr:YbjN domain-containing protein [Treponema sp.]